MDAFSPELLLLAAGAAVAGASLGSFANVVVARLPAGLSVVAPRSRCPRCLAPIAWYDNLPVISWLVLRARCRRCAVPIPVRYPLVELCGAAAALLALRRHGLAAPAAGAAELAFVLLVLSLALIDLDSWLLPHALTLPLAAGGLVLGALGLTPAGGARAALAGGGLGFAAFAAVHYLGRWIAGREALGFGDVWLLAGLGAWLGPGALLPVVLLASVQGTVVGLALLLLGKLPQGGAEPGVRAGSGSAGPERSLEREGGAPAGASPRGEVDPPDADDGWVPPRNAVPFGPFLVAGALEWLYLSVALARAIPALELFR